MPRVSGVMLFTEEQPRGLLGAAFRGKLSSCMVTGLVTHTNFITGAQPKAGTGLKMQTVRFFNVTLLGIYRCLRYIAGSLKSYPPF